MRKLLRYQTSAHHKCAAGKNSGTRQIFRSRGLTASASIKDLTSSGRSASSSSHQVLGDHSERVPPVPIPNTEVKPLSPDCTARAGVWETRKLPGLSLSPTQKVGLFVLCSSAQTTVVAPKNISPAPLWPVPPARRNRVPALYAFGLS